MRPLSSRAPRCGCPVVSLACDKAASWASRRVDSPASHWSLLQGRYSGPRFVESRGGHVLRGDPTAGPVCAGSRAEQLRCMAGVTGPRQSVGLPMRSTAFGLEWPRCTSTCQELGPAVSDPSVERARLRGREASLLPGRVPRSKPTSAGAQRSTQNWHGPGESDCLIKTKHCDGQ